MITLEIPQTKRMLYLPEDLSECDSRQYAEASLLIYRFQHESLSYEDFRMEMLYKLLNLHRGKRKLNHEQKEEMHSNLHGISTLVDSFFDKDEEDKLIIKQYYIHNHTPVIHDTFKKWIGPSDEFNNVDFGQYIDALDIYHTYDIDPSKELLYQLMAIFYLPKGKKYKQYMVDKNWKHFKAVHFGRVYGFFLLFASFQKYIFSAKVYYQGKELDLSILFENSAEKDESAIPGIGMLSIAHQLAQSGVYGNLNKVRNTNLWVILLGLYDARKRDLDNERLRKKEESTNKRKNK